MHRPVIKTFKFQISTILTVVVFIGGGNCGPTWEDAKCATLFSGANFNGDVFILKNWDHTGNIKKDYRSSITGWRSTSTIRVENNCQLTVCNQTYFEGTCRNFYQGDYPHPASQFNSPLMSAKCICIRVCKCEDVFVTQTDRFCGRAYINGSCDDCNSEYAYLWQDENSFLFEEHGKSVKSFKLRKGCNLTVWPDKDKTGPSTVLTNEFVENSQSIGNYECGCDNDKFDPPSASYSQLINLPNTDQKLLKLSLKSPKHPGIAAAIKSMEAGRSSRNVYIVLIGTNYTQYILWTSNCSGVQGAISECHFPLDRDVVGVSNAQLRVITVPIEKVGNLTNDDRWIASLDDYLSNHEDLKDAIPNAVVIVNFPGKKAEINEKTTWFQRKLRVLNVLSYRLLDKNYSNVIFVPYTDSKLRNPEARLLEFERAIEDNWDFPKPTFIVPTARIDTKGLFVNGYVLMKNEVYAYKNLYRSLILLSEKGGDALGNAMFRDIYVSNDGITGSLNITKSLFPVNHTKVELYHQMSNYRMLRKSNFTTAFEQRKAMQSTSFNRTIQIYPNNFGCRKDCSWILRCVLIAKVLTIIATTVYKTGP